MLEGRAAARKGRPLIGYSKIEEELGLTESTIRKLWKDQGFPLVKMGGQVMTTTDLVCDWIAERVKGQSSANNN